MKIESNTMMISLTVIQNVIEKRVKYSERAKVSTQEYEKKNFFFI